MRVVLATARPGLRDALCLFLGSHGVEIVGVVADAAHLPARSVALDPDVVLVDWRPGDAEAAGSLADAVAAIKRHDDTMPVLALSANGDLARAQESGADGHATLGDRPEVLFALLRDMARPRVSRSAPADLTPLPE